MQWAKQVPSPSPAWWDLRLSKRRYEWVDSMLDAWWRRAERLPKSQSQSQSQFQVPVRSWRGWLYWKIGLFPESSVLRGKARPGQERRKTSQWVALFQFNGLGLEDSWMRSRSLPTDCRCRICRLTRALWSGGQEKSRRRGAERAET